MLFALAYERRKNIFKKRKFSLLKYNYYKKLNKDQKSSLLLKFGDEVFYLARKYFGSKKLKALD